MKLFIVVLLCGLSVQALNAHPAEESETEASVNHVDEKVTPGENQVCVPHEVRMEDCNRCKCAPNGVGWFCTRQVCPVIPPDTVTKDASSVPEQDVVHKPPKECEPGTTFKRDCNTCHCTPTGLAACTKLMCVTMPPPEETKPVAKRSVDEKKCEPGTTFKLDCNTCHCTTTGIAACTKKKCVPLPPSEETKPVAKRSLPSEKECEPGTTFKRDCNTCHCTPTGLAACTKTMCITAPPPVESKPVAKRSVDEKECEPGTKWKEDCNSCFCTPTGFKACTLLKCYSLDSLKDLKVLTEESGHHTKRSISDLPNVYADTYSCEPNKQFTHPDGCNTCYCNANGKTNYCTRVNCVSRNKRSPSPISSRGKCTPGQSFLADDGCNTCFCNADGTTGGCTFKLCIDRPRQVRSVENHNDPNAPDFSCVPGTSFKHADGCNDCTCAGNGKVAACTLKLCVDESFKPRRDPFSPNFRCTPGTTFKNDCNTCSCKDDGTTGGCTQIACPPEHHKTKRSPVSNDPASPDFSCQPGTTFKHVDGCNDCTCSDNGKFAACTLKLCVQEPVHVVPAHQDEPLYTGNPYEPGFSCKPEASFKYECNDCRCLANGKVAMCTLKLCNEDNVRITRGINNNNPNAANFRCTPGDQFTHSDGCNSCICSENGRDASCTLKICLSNTPETTTSVLDVVPAQEKKCVPGSRFMSDDGCNTCFCTNDGKVGCTLMYCGNRPMQPLAGGLPPNAGGTMQRPVQFPVDKRYKRETDLASFPHFDTSVEGFKCEPGLRFRDKCNLCRCDAEGRAACTDQLCP